jgi:hypothetical protein
MVHKKSGSCAITNCTASVLCKKPLRPLSIVSFFDLPVESQIG